LDTPRERHAGSTVIPSGFNVNERGTGYARAETMKNVSFTAGPKNGAFVSTRMSTKHHSAEGRMGIVEAVFAGVIVLALAGFAFAILR